MKDDIKIASISWTRGMFFLGKVIDIFKVEFPSNKNRLAVSSKCSFTLLWAGLSRGSSFRQVSFLIYESLMINYKCFLMLKPYRTWSPISAWMVFCRVKRLKSGFRNLYLRTRWGPIFSTISFWNFHNLSFRQWVTFYFFGKKIEWLMFINSVA